MHRFMLIVVFTLIAIGFTTAQTDKQRTITLAVSGMHCDKCVAKVDKALRGVKGVKDVKVDLTSESANIVLASASVSTANLMKAVKAAGFEASLGKPAKTTKKAAEASCCSEKDGAAKTDECCSDSTKKSEKH